MKLIKAAATVFFLLPMMAFSAPSKVEKNEIDKIEGKGGIVVGDVKVYSFCEKGYRFIVAKSSVSASHSGGAGAGAGIAIQQIYRFDAAVGRAVPMTCE